MNYFIFFFALFAAQNILADVAGFSRGSEFQSYIAYGSVTVQCSNGGDFRENKENTFTCRDSFLQPQVFDYFKGPIVPLADTVKLTSRNPQGAIIESVTASYDGIRGLSREPFNLWFSSPIQQSLLREGVNKLQYEILVGGRSVLLGIFEVIVKKSAPKKCAPLKIVSGHGDDCESPFSMCQRFFKERSYCL